MDMNKGRLLTLADYLEIVVAMKPEEFNMAVWKCDTAACAIGHACTIPEFMEAGFRLNDRYKYPTFNNFNSFDAIEAFFGLTDGESRFLFSCQTTQTPQQVAARIRRFVARKHEEHAEQACAVATDLF